MCKPLMKERFPPISPKYQENSEKYRQKIINIGLDLHYSIFINVPVA